MRRQPSNRAGNFHASAIVEDHRHRRRRSVEPTPVGLLASDADRENSLNKLRVALNNGRLLLHEYDDRLEQVCAPGGNYGEQTTKNALPRATGR
ncbi:DUF1707 domain-containing protein [Nocardia sp. NPDC050630]|uniref:DUF1707 domain-containing protein n=1 Tax=Nocardia sp. NPDC050630 TaxID=3364321 RepID=UPI00379D3651